MGVQGLTTWVDQHTTLCEYHELSSDDAASARSGSAAIPFIIDGLAFLSYLFRLNNLAIVDPIRGGNYLELRRLLRECIDYYRAVGLEPEIVWDGPYGTSKTETILRRGRQAIRTSHDFMRSSDDQRAHLHVISRAARLPLLARSACTYELHQLHVKMHSAQAEADSPTAELAQRSNGYAVSQDSDYFILPAISRGYVPLDRIVYGPGRMARPGMLRPGSRTVLRIGVYQPARIAHMLGIHLERLPVFAALAGNDLANLTKTFHSTSSQGKHSRSRPSRKMDIDKVASIIASIESTCTLEETLRIALAKLLGNVQPSTTMLAELAASARSYELVSIETIIPGFPLQPHISDSPEQAQCRRLYFDEIFARGDSANFIYQATQAQLVVSKITVERPEFRSPCLTLGRPLRILIYAVLDDAIGIGAPDVTEYCRREDDLHATLIPIRTVAECSKSPIRTPLLLAPTGERLRFLAGAFEFTIPSSTTRDKTFRYLPLLLALRHIQSYARVPWSRSMLISALATAVTLSSPGRYHQLRVGTQLPRAANIEHIQTSVELVQTLHYLQILLEALLLAQQLTPCHLLFDGDVLHAFLAEGDEVEKLLGQLSGEQVVNEVLGLLELVEQ
ncbi:BQ5605_C007g04632 [Microbotryum silenes-dioicae]|uniref:BQ5605_C007g04632 protein n=1 Tax=Microbotryum silenes-dioicae TaxID=796604 RepID=A0A2X0P9X6_9BASI|nr:BQ5605_C007g04632 [Microbotryum silenes-dioicae]